MISSLPLKYKKQTIKKAKLKLLRKKIVHMFYSMIEALP